jgi:predicted transcriptional regulator
LPCLQSGGRPIHMRLDEVIKIIDGRLLTDTSDAELTKEVNGGCAADLMSDVLAHGRPGAVLVTGLCNLQVVRTAQMAEVSAIILALGKQPPEETIELANQERATLISSSYGVFELCGRLYQQGLPSLETSAEEASS